MSAEIDDPGGTTWRRVPGIDLYWRLLEEQYVVYNGGSGHTHVLDPVAALIIEKLRDRGCTTTKLVREVGVLLNIGANDEFLAKLQQTLRQLAELGLIESLNP
jgi:PqqD family protein of HPr-rel-A system